jgi:glycine cleavage system H protein
MVKVNDHEVVEGLYYSDDYMWVKVEGDKARIGVTDFAQKQLREIVFVELPSTGDVLTVGDTFGTLESVKAVSDLTAPISGTIDEVNDELDSKPELLNEDPYGKGWVVVLSPTDLKKELSKLMDFNKAVEWHKTIEEG